MAGAISTLPHYVSVDGAFEAEHISLPWGDIIGQGVITGGAPATPMLVKQNGSPNMTVLVDGGSCWITNDGISASDKYYRGGAWRCGRSDQVSLSIAAAHATLNRIDRVIAEVLDSQFAGASDLWRYRVITGTPSGSPSAPAEPDNAITLATVSIVAADTAITNAEITDLRPTASVGAKIAVPVPAVQGFGTALPGSPVDGQQFVLTDSITAPTWQWLLRYVAAKSSNKWVFIGGSPKSAEVLTEETTTSTTYAALTTAGPSVAVPVAGDYDVQLNCTGGDSAVYYFMSFDIGGTGAVDADAIRGQNAGLATPVSSIGRILRKSLTAVTLTAKYKNSAGGTAAFRDRRIAITPVAIGG